MERPASPARPNRHDESWETPMRTMILAVAAASAAWSSAAVAAGDNWRPPQSVRTLDVPRDPRAAADAARFAAGSGPQFARVQAERESYGVRDAVRVPAADQSPDVRLAERQRFAAPARDTIPAMSADEAAADRAAIATQAQRAQAVRDAGRFAR
jgi:hypothetical protein